LRRRHLGRPRGDDRRRPGDAGAGEHGRGRIGCLRGHRKPALDEREIGVHLFRGLVPVVGILRQRSQDDQVEVVGNVVANLRRRHGDLREVLHCDLERRVARERDFPRQHLVEDDPDRIDVRALVDRGSAGLLR
jgi:hypothetical protein